MDNVQKASESAYCTQSSEPFKFQLPEVFHTKFDQEPI
jgi:hypothetical protein